MNYPGMIMPLTWCLLTRCGAAFGWRDGEWGAWCPRCGRCRVWAVLARRTPRDGTP